jgi:hypothetical protein
MTRRIPDLLGRSSEAPAQRGDMVAYFNPRSTLPPLPERVLSCELYEGRWWIQTAYRFEPAGMFDPAPTAESGK